MSRPVSGEGASLPPGSGASHAGPPGGPAVVLADFRPGRRDLAAMIGLALPVALVMVSTMAMGVVDTIMVGRVSATDLAAVALGHLYFFGAVVLGMGTLFALDPIIAQAVGAGDQAGIARGVQRGAVLAVGLTLMSSGLLLPAGPVFRLLRQPEDVVPLAAGYALVSIPGVLPFHGFNILRQTLQAMGRVKPILITVVLANLANVFFNWVLIFGNLGFPAMGAVGSGWATSLSRWFMMVTLAVLAWPVLRPTLLPLRPEALRREPLVRLVRLGAPIGGQQFLEFGVFGAAGILMGWMGTVAMASHQVALNLASLTFMVPLGVAQAAAVLVGQAVGRGDAPGARRAAGSAVALGAGFMTFTALVFLSVPGALARIYTDDPQVLALAALLIPIAGIFQVFDGTQVVGLGVLRGVADTRWPMVINLVGFWGLGLPASALLGFRTEMGPRGVWLGLALGIGAVALLLLVRVRRRLGRELRRFVMDEEGRDGEGAAAG